MRGRLLAAGLLTGAVFALNAAPSPAPVPPKDCGFMTVKGHRYNIKADQLRCKAARRYSRRYLKGDGHPKGYSCQNYRRSETAIKFTCTKNNREKYLAIRH